ncbi:DUF4097 family beta strand repeat-containing protein [Actinomadura meridiana]|uniref:DUF4097 family beta strand repeat-containing protein n=1 Tax=Actinomadura meridiana TaxID=559626 RepID=UPI0031EA6CA4
MRTLTITAVLVAGAAATLTGCGNLSFGTHHEDRAYTAPPGITALKIRSGGARVEITASDSPDIKVRERLSWSNGKNKPGPRHTVEDGTLTLSSKCARASIGYTKCSVSYRVQVPRTTPVEVDNDDGAIVASGLAGTVKLHTDNGRLTVTDLRATTVSLDTDDGAIQVSGRAKTVNLHTDSGSINTTGLTTDRLNASTSDGSIGLGGRATVADVRTNSGSIGGSELTSERVTAKTDDGDIDLRLATAPSNVRATSASGTVRVHVPTDQAYAIDLSSNDGARRIDPAVQQDSRSGRRLVLHSNDGDVCVYPN